MHIFGFFVTKYLSEDRFFWIDFDEVNEENYADKSVCPFKTATIINEFVLNDLSVNTNIGSLNKQTTDRNI